MFVLRRSYPHIQRTLMGLLFAVCGLWAGPGNGFFDFDDQKAGTSVLPFLELPVGARASAMGSFEGPTLKDPGALFWNPARISLSRGFQTQFTHAELYGENRHEAAATIFPVSVLGNIGLSFNGVFSTPYEGARDIEENPVDLHTMDFALGAGYGYSFLRDQFLVGAKVTWLHSQLDDVPGDGYALDLGASWILPFGHEVSGVLQNLSHGFTYRSGTHTLEKLPTMLRIGMGYADTASPWAYGIGYSKSNSGFQRLHLGGEWNWQQTFFVRSGYELDFHAPELGWDRGIGLGLGLRINTMGLDYAFRSMGDLGYVHAVTFKVHPPMRYQERKDHMQLARKAWKNGSCTDVIRHAQNALRANPAELDAVALIQACEKEAQVKNGKYVAIAFTANTEGQVMAFHEGELLVGGLSRRKTVVDLLRQQYPQFILLDAGRIVADDSLGANSKRIPKLYEAFSYNHLLLSDSLRQLESGAKLPWLSTVPVREGVLVSSVIPSGKYYVGVLAIQSQGQKVETMQEQILRTREKWSIKPTLQVLLFNGSLTEAEQLAQSLQGIDLMILSGGERLIAKPLQVGSTKILCPGRRGAALGLAVAWFEADTVRYETRMIPIDSRQRPDSTLAAMLGEEWLGQQGENDRVVSVDPGDFLYLQELSDGRRDVWIREAKAGIKRRLNRKPAQFRDAQLAHSRQRLIMLQDSLDRSRLWLQPLNDKEATEISGDSGQVLCARWEPHENWIYFIRSSNPTQADLFRTTWRGTHRTNLTEGRHGRLENFRFSPDGRFLAMQTETNGVRSIWHSSYTLMSPVKISPDSMSAHSPRYDQLAERLVYIVGDPQEGGDLWLWDRRTDQSIALTQGRKIRSVEWNANNTTLLIVDGINLGDVHVLRVDDLDEKSLIDARRDDASALTGARPHRILGKEGVLFQVQKSGRPELRWLDQQGQLSDPIQAHEPVYLPEPDFR